MSGSGVARKRLERAAENKNKGFLGRLGPGLITGAFDDDPSGIGTYSQAGAQVGFGIGWTMLLTYPLMAAIQEISARVRAATCSFSCLCGVFRHEVSRCHSTIISAPAQVPQSILN